MMTLTTMWDGARPLAGADEAPAAAAVLARWEHDPGSLRSVRFSANFVFAFTDGGQRRILRVADNRERSREYIRAEVDLLRWLAAVGIEVAPALPSRQGNLVETIETDRGTYHGVVFPELTGDQLEIDNLDPDHFTAWGATLGRLHAALRRYDAPTTEARGSWRDTLAFIRAHVPATETAVQREAAELADALAALPADADRYGLIHFDFELDNLIWREQGIGVIDFDDCTHHWSAADIAFALRDLFDQDATVADTRVAAFLAGYATHHPLDDGMLDSLPNFSRLARLTTYARIARSLDLPAASDAGVPTWLRAIEERFRSRMTAYQASLDGEAGA